MSSPSTPCLAVSTSVPSSSGNATLHPLATAISTPATRLKALNAGRAIAAAVGASADVDSLTQVADTVVVVDPAQPGSLREFFRWVSMCVSATLAAGEEASGDRLPRLAPLSPSLRRVP